MQVKLFHQRQRGRGRQTDGQRQTDVHIYVSINIFYFGCRCVSTDGWMEQWARGCCGRVTGLDEKCETVRDSQDSKIHNTCCRVVGRVTRWV